MNLVVTADPPETGRSTRVWLLSFLSVLLVGIALRAWALGHLASLATFLPATFSFCLRVAVACRVRTAGPASCGSLGSRSSMLAGFS